MQEKELGFPEDCLSDLHDLMLGRPITRNPEDLPEGTRQILIVDRHTMMSGNFIESTASGRIAAESVILLEGHHSPSSEPGLSRAYLTFVDDGRLRQPSYNKERGVIRLWLRYRNLPMVLEQLKEPNRYCWIGHFSGGHIYGDIHTSQ